MMSNTSPNTRLSNTSSPSSGYFSGSSSPPPPIRHEHHHHLPALMDLPLLSPPSIMDLAVPRLHPVYHQQSHRILLGNQGCIKCPHDGTPLITILSFTGDREVWGYSGANQKPVLHECAVCSEQAFSETELDPYYSMFDGQEYIVFAQNLKTKKVEQFAFRNGFVKVERPSLIYKERKLDFFFAIGPDSEFIQKTGDTWEKKRFTLTGWVSIPSLPVTTETKSSKNVSHKPKFPELMVVSCCHFNQDLLMFKTLKAGRLIVYRFDMAAKKFKACECFKCFPKDLYRHRNIVEAPRGVPEADMITPRRENKGFKARSVRSIKN